LSLYFLVLAKCTYRCIIRF